MLRALRRWAMEFSSEARRPLTLAAPAYHPLNPPIDASLMPAEPTAESEINLQCITLPTSLYPVLNGSGFAPSFAVEDMTVWSKEAPDTTVPFTLDLVSPKDQHLTFSIMISDTIAENYHEHRYRVSGWIDGENILRDEDCHTVLGGIRNFLLLTAKMTTPNALVPWGVRGNVHWKLHLPATGQEVSLGIYPIEYYAISSKVPPSLAHHGVPVELVRLLLGHRKTKNISSFQDYVKYVVNFIHSGTLSRYDRKNGKTRFAERFRLYKGITPVDLNTWLEDLRAAEASGKHFDVNCYDQGVLVQLCLTLAILNSDQSRRLRFHYLCPYGFINPTHLVGWEPDAEGGQPRDKSCNSPFSKRNPITNSDLYVEPNDETRRAFRNHVFLSYDWKVLDATCGPALGSHSIGDYLEVAVDRTTSLYGLPGEERQGRFPDNDCPQGGAASDVATGPGIESLRTSLALPITSEPSWALAELYVDPRSVSRGATTWAVDIAGITKALETIQLPTTTLKFGPSKVAFSIDPNTRHISWRAETSNGSSVDIDIFSGNDSSAAIQHRNEYLAGYQGSLDRLFVGGPSSFKTQHYLVTTADALDGCRLWISGNVFVVLEGLESSDELAPLAELVEEHITKSELTTRVINQTSDSEDGERYLQCVVGKTTTIPIKAPNTHKYSVQYATGSAFLLRVDRDDASSTYNFIFLGTRCGLEIATTFIIDGTATEQEDHICVLKVLDSSCDFHPLQDPANDMKETKFTTSAPEGYDDDENYLGTPFSSFSHVGDGLRDYVRTLSIGCVDDRIDALKIGYGGDPFVTPGYDKAGIVWSEFQLKEDEFIVAVTGGKAKGVIASLQLHTSHGRSSPVYGNASSTSAHSFCQSGPKLVYISGRHNNGFTGIRTHWLDPNSIAPSIEETMALANSHSAVVGTECGDIKGSDAQVLVDGAEHRLTAIFVRVNGGDNPEEHPIESLIARYDSDKWGTFLGFVAPQGDPSRKHSFELRDDEWIVKITGTVDSEADREAYINTIQFFTNQDRISEVFGMRKVGRSFELSGDKLVYLSGRASHTRGLIALQAHWMDSGAGKGGRDLHL